MNILALNSSSDFIEVALLRNNNFFYISKKLKIGRYEDLILLIKQLLSKARLELKDLNCLGVCVGPGSFTGIRLGLSTMKALAYSTKKPLVGFRSLELLAWSVMNNFQDILCVIQDAKRNNLYFAIFGKRKDLKQIGSYRLINVSDLLSKLRKFANKRAIFFTGDAVWAYKTQLKQNFPNAVFLNHFPKDGKAKAMIELTKFYLRKRRLNNFSEAQPLYLYSRYCQVKSHQN